MRQFTVDASDPTQPVVEIDGQSIDPHLLVGIDLAMSSSDVPRLALYVHPAAVGKLSGVGEVIVAEPSPDQERRWVASAGEWLASLDPADLERRAAEQMGWGDSDRGSVGASFVAALAGMLADAS